MRCGRNRALALAAVCAALAACGRPAEQAPAARTSSAPPATSGAAAHGDHNPHHGGIVLMKGSDLHYEVVLDPTGRLHHVFFTDAMREDLPASIASTVALTVQRPGRPDEPIAMRIDDAGESWVGRGNPIAAPATVRIAFTIRGEPYFIDVPFAPGRQ